MAFDRGSITLDSDYSRNYALIEKIAKQVITGVESTNRLQWIDKGKIIHGASIEQAVVALADGYDWVAEDQTGENLNAPKYPKIVFRYFKEWTGRQFKTTVSENQIDKVILAGGSEKDISEKIVSSLTEGEGDEDYKYSKMTIQDGITGGNIQQYKEGSSETNGAIPVSEQLITAIKDITDKLQFVGTEFVAAGYRTRTPFERIRLVMNYKIFNKLNVEVLASLYNLSKAELLSKISLIDEGTKVFVLDEWGLIKYTRVYKLTSKYIEDGLYSNYWLTVDRMYGTSGLFKMAYIETDPAGTNNTL